MFELDAEIEISCLKDFKADVIKGRFQCDHRQSKNYRQGEDVFTVIDEDGEVYTRQYAREIEPMVDIAILDGISGTSTYHKIPQSLADKIKAGDV